ncbi:MAG: helix-turn-helix domain-containing protein [Candidatus Bathyarchaeota archaeon]
MSAEEFEGLKRADSQRDVFLCLVESGEPMSSQEIAEKLKITVNAVNIALFQLNKKNLVDRISRGSYKYKLGPLLLTLLREYFEE